jgi:hypothetical protein
MPVNMKKLAINGFALIFGIAAFWIEISGCYLFEGDKGRRANFEAQLGTYSLDIQKTALGPYSKDSNTYRNLTITFNADSSFIMNMKVPFLYDSVGSWTVGDMKEWNWLRFKSFHYSASAEHSGSQFTRPYLEDSIIFFLINGATPQNGTDFIQDIYFKKVNHF